MSSKQENIPTAGVIGWPVSHSRSPLIHGYWLEELELVGKYEKFGIALDEIKKFLLSFKSLGLCGANLTIPHKEIALKYCDEIDSVAVEIGAVNTIWLDGGKLFGTNTDAYGFSANLDQQIPDWDKNPNSAVVLGAGGSARAIIWALANRGFEQIHIVNRTYSKAETLSNMLPNVARPCNWLDVDKLLSNAQLLVNTTSLGMVGQPNLNIDLSTLPEQSVVCDLVYVPLETNLLKSARNNGLRGADGLGMLLHQAVPGFEKWFGKRPEVSEELRQHIVSDLGEAS